MSEAYSDAELEAAIDQISGSAGLREAELLVDRAAPQLQMILAKALESGGWFGESHEAELRRALELEDEAARSTAIRTLLAEETRMGMMVGVAVGWALAERLRQSDPKESD